MSKKQKIYQNAKSNKKNLRKKGRKKTKLNIKKLANHYKVFSFG